MFGTGVELSKILSGKLVGDGNLPFDGVSTDTRKIKKGELFIALRGVRYDAHEFVSMAIKAGAVGVVVDRDVKIPAKNVFKVNVSDTRLALKRLASYWRNKVNPVLIAVTGSCGKTTTKELIFSILNHKKKTLKNHANLNNFYGLCQTLLQLRDESYAVVEVGINNVNEMEELVSIAMPQAGIITNIAPVHLEGLKSMKEIYKEKKMVLDNSKDAVFINADDKFLKDYKNENVKMYTFGKRGRFSYKDLVIKHLDGMVFTVFDREDKQKAKCDVLFPYTGIALPENVTGAVAVGRYFNVDWQDIATAIRDVRLPGLRMERLQVGRCNVILDAYNANPASIRQAIDTFELIEGENKAVVLGDMRELGRFSKFYHQLLGKRLLKCKFKNILLIGKEIIYTYEVLKAQNIKYVKYFETVDDAKTYFNRLLDVSDMMLIKGSRLIALEKLVFGEKNAL